MCFPKEIEEMEYVPLTKENMEKIKEQLETLDTINYLDSLCNAIKVYEGWFEGSRSFRNNNPGNCKFSPVGYLPKYGEVKRDKDNFAIFSSYEIGWEYLQNLVKEKCKKHPDWNLVSFFKEYAPDNDGNNSTNYASWVAKRMGVSPFTFKLRELLV